MARQHSSQEIWTEAEALERAGKGGEAIDLYVQAAVAEEDAHRPLRARVLWEQVAQRTGPTGALMERLARVCGRAHLDDEAFAYWVAAAAQFRADGRTDEAESAAAHALDHRRRMPAGAPELPPLALAAIGSGETVRDLLG